MENYQTGAFGPDSQDANLDYKNSQFPGNTDSESVFIGDVYGQSEFVDADFERMSDSEYFNYLRSQDDML